MPTTADLTALGIRIASRTMVMDTSQRGHPVGSPRTRMICVLPNATPLHVTFSKERFVEKIAKLFKSEVQAGEPLFDAAVYISTDTPELTKRFVSSIEIRNPLAMLVLTGPVTIEVDRVTLEMPGYDEGDDSVTEDAFVILRALLQ